MFEILDTRMNTVIDRAAGREAATRRANALQFSTLRPYHLREAKAEATLLPAVLWINDMPVPV